MDKSHASADHKWMMFTQPRC